MTEIDIEHLRQWIGRKETVTDHVTPVPLAGLRALLNMDDLDPVPGGRVPPMWHCLFFLPVCKQSELSDNGHPVPGDFMPPIPFPLRMYAGGNMLFHDQLRIGDEVTKTSSIADINYKEGRSGPLVFLKIRHEISGQSGIAITEEQDIVYRQAGKDQGSGTRYRKAPDNYKWISEQKTDPVLLFRFSALTFNAHRIHYDYPYVTKEEGYPGLIVHGPLIALLLLDLLEKNIPGVAVEAFWFRASQPVFCPDRFFLCGRPEEDGKNISLWASNSGGVLCLEAGATIR